MEKITGKDKIREEEIKRQIKSLRRIALAIFIIPMILFIVVFIFLIKTRADGYDYDKRFGVFIGISRKDVDKLEDYQTVIIDAEYFTKADIRKLKKAGKTVYTYLSIGSLEDYRPYYKKYKNLALSGYDGWKGEYWVNTADKGWQKEMLRRAGDFKKKGIDGFFIDNTDVYYHYKRAGIYKGLVNILTGIKKMNAKLIINGGDEFVTKYIKENKTLKQIADGVNQEGVFSLSDGDDTGAQKQDVTKYYTDYLAKLSKKGIHIYLTEYVKDNDELEEKIAEYCEKRGWDYYISDDLALD